MVTPRLQLLLSCTVPGDWSAQGLAPNPCPAWDSGGARGLVFPGIHMVPPAGQCCHCQGDGGGQDTKGLSCLLQGRVWEARQWGLSLSPCYLSDK